MLAYEKNIYYIYSSKSLVLSNILEIVGLGLESVGPDGNDGQADDQIETAQLVVEHFLAQLFGMVGSRVQPLFHVSLVWVLQLADQRPFDSLGHHSW